MRLTPKQDTKPLILFVATLPARMTVQMVEEDHHKGTSDCQGGPWRAGAQVWGGCSHWEQVVGGACWADPGWILEEILLKVGLSACRTDLYCWVPDTDFFSFFSVCGASNAVSPCSPVEREGSSRELGAHSPGSWGMLCFFLFVSENAHQTLVLMVPRRLGLQTCQSFLSCREFLHPGGYSGLASRGFVFNFSSFDSLDLPQCS